MRAAARYLKGYEMLEPYAVKVARTVLRRGGASNRFLLSLQHRNLVEMAAPLLRRLCNLVVHTIVLSMSKNLSVGDVTMKPPSG